MARQEIIVVRRKDGHGPMYVGPNNKLVADRAKARRWSPDDAGRAILTYLDQHAGVGWEFAATPVDEDEPIGG